MNTVDSLPQRKTRRSAESVATAPSAQFEGDTLLVRACQDGDRDSQRQLYERYCQQVYRLMHRMVGAQYADDLTQQVFLRALQSLGQFAGRSAFATWLYRLAVNEALQFLRRNKRHESQRYGAEPADTRTSTRVRLDDHELLEHALAQLDSDLRTIFLLREVEGLSYYELALVLDVAEGTVASRLNRARRVLRELLTETD